MNVSTVKFRIPNTDKLEKKTSTCFPIQVRGLN